MQIKIINKSTNPLPMHATVGSSGVDLRANLEQDLHIEPLARVIVPTGLFIEIPQGFEGQVRSRSGLTLNKGLVVANSPGTIDSDYTGELKVIMLNLSHERLSILHGDRIAQLIIAPYVRIDWLVTDELTASTRGTAGFGSTGLC